MSTGGGSVSTDDDDFLIDDGADAAEGAEEEDLLADVQRPAGAAWDWSDDSFQAPGGSPPPEAPAAPPARAQGGRAAAPAKAAPAESGAFAALDDLFAAAPSTQMAVAPKDSLSDLLVEAAPPAVSGITVLLVDPVGSEEGPVARALKELGFTLTVVETGAAAREELEGGGHNLVVLVVDRDTGWARMLMMAAQDREQAVNFVGVTPASQPALAQQLRAAGAAQVVEGLTTSQQLLGVMQAAAPELFPGSANTAALAAELKALQQQMAERVAETEARAQEAEVRAQQAAAAAQQREREITGVRSELTGLRQRCELLDSRARRAEDDTRRLRETVVQLQQSLQDAEARAASAAAEAEAARSAPPPPAPVDPNVAKLRQLAAALGPYGVAVDQVLEFLGKAAQAAAHGTPAEWQRHIKNLTLTRQIMRKVEASSRGDPNV